MNLPEESGFDMICSFSITQKYIFFIFQKLTYGTLSSWDSGSCLYKCDTLSFKELSGPGTKFLTPCHSMMKMCTNGGFDENKTQIHL